MKQGMFRIRTGEVTKPYERALKRAERNEVASRVMQRDASVLSSNTKVQALIKNRLGWTDSASAMKRTVRTIEQFGEKAIKDGIRHVVLMGMGGSSLCPEVFSLMFGNHRKLVSFDVLDSTDPEAIRRVLRKIKLTKALGIVASKSGGTVETRSQEAIFMQALTDAGVKQVGRHMVAITDPGSALEAFAKKNKYRKVFLNPTDIGGRYSALSYFGLVPGYFGGVDLRALLDRAIDMQRLLIERTGETNPADVLGTLMASAAVHGRDKLTFLASKQTAPFIPWLEQLIAESTGKKKKGVVPIDNEPALKSTQYGSDRLFVDIRLANEKPAVSEALKRRLAQSGAPLVEIVLRDLDDLGGQFVLWEAATAVAGYHLRINPFDEPNVTESKDNTKELLSVYERDRELPIPEPIATFGKLTLLAVGTERAYRKQDLKNLTALLKRFFTGMKPPEYVSLLGYFASDRNTEKEFEQLREKIAGRKRVATIRGYGPRYLHSIGQLYKGGPELGRFIVFGRNSYGRLEIPGAPYDLGTLISAQAQGDVAALIKRGLPVLVIVVEGKPAEGIAQVSRAIGSALK
ncbi:hypothetical protein GF420_11275 [candidate division GN15 bacterium]|nr:hypothetical protein [candidate division GN15 bacterium]